MQFIYFVWCVGHPRERNMTRLSNEPFMWHFQAPCQTQHNLPVWLALFFQYASALVNCSRENYFLFNVLIIFRVTVQAYKLATFRTMYGSLFTMNFLSVRLFLVTSPVLNICLDQTNFFYVSSQVRNDFCLRVK